MEEPVSDSVKGSVSTEHYFCQPEPTIYSPEPPAPLDSATIIAQDTKITSMESLLITQQKQISDLTNLISQLMRK